MTIPFLASLRTSRQVERGVSFHGSTQESVEKPARAWLESLGEHGDFFVVTEFVRLEHSVIECDKPKPALQDPKWNGHPFKDGKSPLHCYICNGTYEEHLKA